MNKRCNAFLLKSALISLLGLLSCQHILSAQTALAIQPATSSAGFVIKNLGVEVDGTFGVVEGTIAFDPNQLATSYIEGKASVATLSTGDKTRDRHLKEENYFDAAAYPYISFKSTTIEHIAGGRYRVSGDFTIKDVTKLVAMEMEVMQLGQQRKYTTSFQIERTAYHVGKKSVALADKATIRVTFTTALPADRPVQHR